MPSTDAGPAAKAVTLTVNGKELNLAILPDEGSHSVLNEIFHKHCYELLPFLREAKTIVDVGANVGAASAWFRLHYPEAAITAFEPDPRAAAVLEKNASVIGNIQIYPFGLYSQDCTKDFFLGKTSTIYGSIYPHRLSSPTHFSIDLKHAGDFLRRQKIQAIDILKVDAEGCETAILKSFGKALADVKIVYLQFHSESDRRTLDDLLQETHQLYCASISQAHRGYLTYVHRDLPRLQFQSEAEPLHTEKPNAPTVGKLVPQAGSQTLILPLKSDSKLPSSPLQRYLEKYASVDGWFSPESAAVWDCLLFFQKGSQISGNFLEIGVWRGKSAALSTLHAEAYENCILVDPSLPKEVRSLINGIKPENVVYAEKCSTELIKTGLLTTNAHTFRWIHIDGEHSGPAIINDLNIANALLNEKGIIVVDDFLSPAYPQITAAVFQWLHHHPLQLQLFLCGLNKAYLCRTNAAITYLRFVKDALYNDMARRGFKNLTVWKTTTTADMNCFGITDRFQDFAYRGPDWNQNKIEI